MVQKGHFDEAEQVIHKMAAVNKREVPDLSVLRIIAEQARVRRKAEGQYSYHDLFRTFEMGKRAVVVMLCWWVL